MSEVVIITGMHRSGTSLTASLLQRAGIHLGDRLLPPAPGNPRGHFEDVDFYVFHAAVLRRLGQGLLVQNPLPRDALQPAEVDEARRLIEQRRHRPIWGWKDPRTALFLDLWYSLLPQARFVFVYRHPVEVVLSLLRRGSDLEVLVDPLAGLRSWYVYNAAMLDFYERYRSVCLLCPINGITKNIVHFMRIVEKTFGLQLQKNGLNELYDENMLQTIPFCNEIYTMFKEIDYDCFSLYEKIDSQSDLLWKTDLQDGNTQDKYILLAREMLEQVGRQRDIPREVATRTLCTSLLALLDPATMASLPRRTQALIETWRHKEGWLEDQLETQQARMSELAAGKAWLEAQWQQAQALAAARQQELETQQAWMSELAAGKAWLEAQWQQAQALVIAWQKQPWIRLGARLKVLKPLVLDRSETAQGEP